MRLGKVGIEGERLVVAGQGLLRFAKVLECIAEIVVGLGKIGLKVNGFVTMRNRFV